MKIEFPNSEKVYMTGERFPFVKVGMRKVKQMPTVEIVDGERVFHKNPDVYIYDTSGAFGDALWHGGFQSLARMSPRDVWQAPHALSR